MTQKKVRYISEYRNRNEIIRVQKEHSIKQQLN